MPRDYSLFLNNIIRACEKILKYTKEMSKDQFFQDDLVYDAVLRNLIIIGEASKKIPDEIRNQFKNVEWKKISGLRDIITHAYFGIDNLILWDIIKTKIEPLLKALQNPL